MYRTRQAEPVQVLHRGSSETHILRPRMVLRYMRHLGNCRGQWPGTSCRGGYRLLFPVGVDGLPSRKKTFCIRSGVVAHQVKSRTAVGDPTFSIIDFSRHHEVTLSVHVQAACRFPITQGRLIPDLPCHPSSASLGDYPAGTGCRTMSFDSFRSNVHAVVSTRAAHICI